MNLPLTLYQQVISIEHLFQSWNEFKIGKRNRKDVALFERALEDNLFNLYSELKNKTYKHRLYTAFNIYDPKFRHIHKAIVRDRIVHHALTSVIEPIFDRTFIYDSYSCRTNKGIHKAAKRLFSFIRKVSKNYSGSCFVLKLDIKKFFASVDHKILLGIVKQKIIDPDTLWLVGNIITSFSETRGIPIGNLTSQIFANIYLNRLDQFIKHQLRKRFYIRYCDDFVIAETNKEALEQLVPKIAGFLETQLNLSLHEQKIVIRKYTQGIDFLGYVLLPHTILPRTKTKRRIFTKLKTKITQLNENRISQISFNQTLASYFGFLKHSKSYKLTENLKNQIRLWTGKISMPL